MPSENVTARREQENRRNMVVRCKNVGELFRAVFGRPMYYAPRPAKAQAIESLSLETGCGEHCARTILAAQQFIKAGLPDFGLVSLRDRLAELVVEQLEVYYIG